MAAPIVVAGIASGLVASGVALGSGAGLATAALVYAGVGLAGALVTVLLVLRCPADATAAEAPPTLPPRAGP
jgi:hypothetical protein